MGGLLLQLVPLALGIMLSPLAVMALVAVLVSKLARVNGIAFLIGWSIGVVGVVVLGLWLFSTLEVHARGAAPLWADGLRVLLAVFLIGAAVLVYRRGHRHVQAMAAASTPQDVVKAAPQLPGWLQKVSTFRPGRCVILGVGIFVLNPVDGSCALLASLDIVLAGLPTATTVAVVIAFCVVGVLPIAAPVLCVVARGERSQPALARLRDWVATHTNVLNAALLLVIGAMQLQKGLTGLL